MSLCQAAAKLAANSQARDAKGVARVQDDSAACTVSILTKLTSQQQTVQVEGLYGYKDLKRLYVINIDHRNDTTHHGWHRTGTTTQANNNDKAKP